jgi:hypothetical protein|tara:strand:+ start:231 stop:458 length:228 start_codon:yes stop_codon:yes gene_type:complete
VNILLLATCIRNALNSLELAFSCFSLINQTDGGGASQGRFALVFFLVLVAGKNKAVLDILPLLGGFFTYQVGLAL